MTGEIRAHVGGTGYFDSIRAGQMDLASALRSPGSTLKPFIYGLAFEDGVVHPETLIDDRAVRYGAYAPENFDDSFHGTVTVRTALQQSLNVPALQILNAVGPDRLAARLTNAGVKLVLPENEGPGLAVGLGGAGVRLTDLTALYVALARGGEPVTLSWQIEERRNAKPLRRLFEPNATWMIGDVLKGAPTPQNALGGQIAFKTGTSYGYRDAWAVGYDGATTIAVWVGRPDGAAVPGVVGRLAAAPILFEAFQRLGPSRKALPPAPPGTVIARTANSPRPSSASAPTRFRKSPAWRKATRPRPSPSRPMARGSNSAPTRAQPQGLRRHPTLHLARRRHPHRRKEFRRDTFWETAPKASPASPSSTPRARRRQPACAWSDIPVMPRH